MAPTVQPVTTPAEREVFLRLLWRLYRGDPHWVPPLLFQQRALLDPAQHPFHQHATVQLFLAYEGPDPVGRIAAIVNQQHIAVHQEAVGFFGFFETVPSVAVAQALLQAAADWLRAQGMVAMRGPVNPSTNDECGLLVEGFDRPPVFMMPYNPPSYPALLEACGLRKAKDLYAYYIHRDWVDLQRYQRLADRLRERAGVVVRPGQMARFEAELMLIKQVYNRAWERNWGFVPMTDAEFAYLARALKPLVVPELVQIALVGEEPAGFALVLPDYNQVIRHLNGRLGLLGLLKFLWYRRRISTIRVMALGVVPEHRKKGIEALMILHAWEQAHRRGYQDAEVSWILEDNHLMNNTIRNLGCRHYKTYRIYEQPLTA